MSKILEGDCLKVMAGMEENSVDSIVCDPPYALGFMGKAWDRFPTDKGPKKPFANQSKESKLGGMPYQEWCRGWAVECLRVAKPGAYLLAFGGTRTFHRLACAIEDAGWTLRDTLSWNYGSGFPKSHDISKAIDKKNYKWEIDLSKFGQYIKRHRMARGWSLAELDKHMGTNTAASWWEGRKNGVQLPSKKTYEKLKEVLGLDNSWDYLINWAEANREIVGKAKWKTLNEAPLPGADCSKENRSYKDLTAPATPEAKQWDGFGTALKPAWEPVLLFQKPLEGTYAENVLKWGCGALNIDGCRIGKERVSGAETGREIVDAFTGEAIVKFKNKQGRWPANFLLSHTIFCEKVGEREAEGYAINRFTDGAKPFGGGAGHPYETEKQGGQMVDIYNCVPDCPVRMLDAQSGNRKGGGAVKGRPLSYMGNKDSGEIHAEGYADQGGASRFFYCAKASRRERNAGLEELNALFEKRSGFGVTTSQATTLNPTRPICNQCGCGTVAVGSGKTLTCRHTDIRFEPARSKPSANKHPTVKPIALMRYLCRLVTPPGGTVLDPFAGSGSTGCAAVLEGFEIIGIEKEKGYAEIARARIKHWEGRREDGPEQR